MALVEHGATSHVCCGCCADLPAAAFRASSPKEHGGWFDLDGVRRKPVCIACTTERQRRYRNAEVGREKGALLAGRGYLPVAPFREWVLRKRDVYRALYPNTSNGGHPDGGFAAYIGLNERRLFDIVKGRSQVVSVDLVDSALIHEGSTMLWQVYPELYADDEVAA